MPDRVPEIVGGPVMELVMVGDPVRVLLGLTEAVLVPVPVPDPVPDVEPVRVCVWVPVPVKEGVCVSVCEAVKDPVCVGVCVSVPDLLGVDPVEAVWVCVLVTVAV